MIQLINGRGQLGKELKSRLDKTDAFTDKDAIIYHTWNILDKSEGTQKNEFEKFRRYLESNQNRTLMFISTYSQQNNFYNYYKQLSESHLITNNPNGYAIRLPTLIGKGICQSFKEGKAQPYGQMELMSVENAAKNVLSELEQILRGVQKLRNIRINGDIVSAELVCELIKFGKR